MNILFVGDTYGDPGKEMLKKHFKEIQKLKNIDFSIVNVENITNGKSINKKDYQLCTELKIDALTSGNHIMFLNEGQELLNSANNLIRPLNFNSLQPGKGSIVFNCKNKTIRVTNIIGRTFMPDFYDNPYLEFEKILQSSKEDIHIVDFHAETTSEKIAFATKYDGKITAFCGTHTHVQTADERILPNGTAFITDIGMTGPYHSVIGVEPEAVIKKQRTGLSSRFFPANNSVGQFCAVILQIDEKNKCTKIERILITPQKNYLGE